MEKFRAIQILAVSFAVICLVSFGVMEQLKHREPPFDSLPETTPIPEENSTTNPQPDTAENNQTEQQQQGHNDPQKSEGEDKEVTKLDLVFAVDTTGSMGSYIEEAKANIQNIIRRVISTESCNVRFALVEYRDHPPEDTSFVTRTSPFTDNLLEMQLMVSRMHASGGGDGPETVTSALWDALQLPWRQDSAKVVVLISDAPPHGLGEPGDAFPNGDPSGNDPLHTARLMAQKGIVIYAVGVEPTLSNYKFGRDFMMALAKITEGKYLPLKESALLATVVVGGAVEELSLNRLMDQVKEKSQELEAAGLSDVEIKHKVGEFLLSQNVETNQLEVDDIYGNDYNYQNRDKISFTSSMAELRGMLDPELNKDVINSAHKPVFSGAHRSTASLGVYGHPEAESVVTGGMLHMEGMEILAGSGEEAPEPIQSASYSKKTITTEQAFKLHSRYMSMAKSDE